MVCAAGSVTSSANSSASLVSAFLLPRTVSNTSIVPSALATSTGFIFSSVPAIALVAETLPPFLRYFRSLTVNTECMFSLWLSSQPHTSSKLLPSSPIFAAYISNSPSPIEALYESKTHTFLAGKSAIARCAASHACLYVPDMPEDIVLIITSFPASSEGLISS